MIDKVKTLLEFGFFPSNILPPGFRTNEFADFYSKNMSKFSNFNVESKCIDFSCPKINFARKIFKIPAPGHYAQLCSFIVKNWTDLNLIFNLSDVSFSKPSLNEDKVKNSMQFFSDFKIECLKNSFKYSFELQTDISRFYPTLYTHSLTWAIHSKQEAKQKTLKKNAIGERLDYHVRQLQDKQTNGIPIGPYASQIISEILNCKIDFELKKRIENLSISYTGLRFIDDRYYYINNQSDAESILNEIQSLFRYYSLEMNAAKTSIRKLPISIIPDWKIRIHNFNFRHSIRAEGSIQLQRNDILIFFNMVFTFVESFPNDYVLKYAIILLNSIEIYEENWDLLEPLLYQSLLKEPFIFPELLDIIFKYQTRINKINLESILSKIIYENIVKENDFEIAWALHIAKVFKIQLNETTITYLFKISNPICLIIIADLIDKELLPTSCINLTRLNKEIISESLLNEDWILAYELANKKWLLSDFSYINLVHSNSFYKKLIDNNISFYFPDISVAEKSKVEGYY